MSLQGATKPFPIDFEHIGVLRLFFLQATPSMQYALRIDTRHIFFDEGNYQKCGRNPRTSDLHSIDVEKTYQQEQSFHLVFWWSKQ